MMKSKPLRARLRKACSEARVVEHVLDVGDVRAGQVLAEVLETLVVGLAPAAVVVGSDEDHGDVELALLDVGDLELGAFRGGRAGAGTFGRAPERARRGRAADGEQPLVTRANVPRSAASLTRRDAIERSSSTTMSTSVARGTASAGPLERHVLRHGARAPDAAPSATARSERLPAHPTAPSLAAPDRAGRPIPTTAPRRSGARDGAIGACRCLSAPTIPVPSARCSSAPSCPTGRG